MACELILGPSFRVLKSRLLSTLSRRCATHPLSPKWVLVPTSTAANHLRLEIGTLARRSPLAAVRAIPMPLFVARLLELIPAAAGPRWEPAFEFLLYEMVMHLPQESRLSRLQGVTGGYARLKSTFLDLAEGGFGLEQFEAVEELVQSDDLPPIERETLQFYLHWLQTLDAAGLEWDPQLRRQLPPVIEEASEPALNQILGAEEGQQPLLLVYGFYEFTDIHLGILTALARRIPTSLYLPHFHQKGKTHPAFSFTDDILHDLRARIGTALTTEQQEVSDEEPLQFFLNSFPEGHPGSQPGFLSHQSASGVRSEVLSAAVQIRKWLDRDDIEPHEILLVAPRIETYAATAREVFASFSIPLRVLDLDPGLTPENRPYICLRRIWEERAPVDWVLSYLRDYPGICKRRSINISRFEKKLRRLPLLTSHSWRVLEQLIAEENEAMEHFRFTPAEASLIEEICQLWIPTEDRAFSGSAARTFLKKISEDWMPRLGMLDPLINGLEIIERLRPDLRLPEKMLLDLFIRSTPRERLSDPMTSSGVLLAPLMRARGITAKAVVLLGLSSDQIPYRLEEDPLLSDLTRYRLTRASSDIGHRLPVKARLSDEMALLFFLVNTAAERVHWVLPETDEQGKSVAITPWVQRYLQHWKEVAEGTVVPPRIPRSPREQAQLLYELSPHDGQALPPSFARTIGIQGFPLLEESDPEYWQPQTNRRHLPPEWNGFVPAASLSQQFPLVRVSVTQLESLARCPFRFYAQVVERLAPLEVLDFTEEPSALDWGRLVHELLESCFSSSLNEQRSLSSVARELLADDRAGLKEKLEQLSPEALLLFRLFPDYLAQALRIRLLAIVGNYLKQVVREEDSAVPLHLERKLEVTFPNIPTLQVVGKIDRIDQMGGKLRVIDYKSGSDPWKNDSGTSQRQHLEVLLGYRMQPHLYPWLTREAKIGDESEFQFLYLGDEPPVEKTIRSDIAAEELLTGLSDIFVKGYYFPTSTEAVRSHLDDDQLSPCAWCDFISVCRRFDDSASYHAFNLLQQRVGGRFEAVHKFLSADDDECLI